MLLELQALCVASKFGISQRVITGIDPKRIMLIAAILEKHLHIKFSSQDIFFKVSIPRIFCWTNGICEIAEMQNGLHVVIGS